MADKFLYKLNLTECNYYKSCAHINITEYIGIKINRGSATLITLWLRGFVAMIDRGSNVVIILTV